MTPGMTPGQHPHGNSTRACRHRSSSGRLDQLRYRYNIYGMTVTHTPTAPWLLLVFSLPTRSASQRVQTWRKIQRYGMLALRSSGYVLPNNAVNQERMEWLATAIRTIKDRHRSFKCNGSMICLHTISSSFSLRHERVTTRSFCMMRRRLWHFPPCEDLAVV